MIKVDILKDPIAFAKANEIHTIAFMEQDYAILPKDMDVVIENNSDYFMFSSKVSWPTMNAVMSLNRNAKFSRKRVNHMAEFLEGRAEMQMWFLGEYSTPVGVEETLVEFGLKRMEWPMMAADLTLMDFTPLENLSETKSIQIKNVTSEEDLKKWLSVAQDVYRYPDSYTDALGHIYRTRLSEGKASNIQNFIAEIEEVSVGVSSLYLHEGLAGLYYVGTKEKYRGQRVGTAVTLAAMQEARVRGYEVGILGSSKLGFGVYIRVGFKECYTMSICMG